MPPVIKTWTIVMSLEALLRSLSPGVMHDNGKTFYRQSLFLFFLPSFLSILEKVHVNHLFFFYFIFSSYVFYCLFSSLALSKKVFIYQFSPWIRSCHMLFFPIWSLFFWFLIFTFISFVKVLLVLNFIFQLKFMLSYFFSI